MIYSQFRFERHRGSRGDSALAAVKFVAFSTQVSFKVMWESGIRGRTLLSPSTGAALYAGPVSYKQSRSESESHG
jgi:hypothetical protein